MNENDDLGHDPDLHNLMHNPPRRNLHRGLPSHTPDSNTPVEPSTEAGGPRVQGGPRTRAHGHREERKAGADGSGDLSRNHATPDRNAAVEPFDRNTRCSGTAKKPQNSSKTPTSHGH